MRLTFKETSFFTRFAGELLSDQSLCALQWALMANPEKGELIRGSGGLRKLRWPAAGRGKRGGLRVIYYWHLPDDVILLLLVYPKSGQENLEPSQVKFLKTIIESEFP